MQACRLGRAVGHRDANGDVLEIGLGVLDLDLEVAVVRESAGIGQLVLGIESSAPRVLGHEILIREG